MIDVRNVTYRYPGAPEPALEDVSAIVRPGETVGIVGPNGSGKSTLGRLMKGLLLPTEGIVTVDGLETARDPLAARRLVGLVFQNPNSQIVNSVVEDEVAFGPENLGLPQQEIRRRVDEALRTVGLTERARAESHALSMADKQRVALASTLAMQPRYLILDEPTAWLESAARDRLLAEIGRWREAVGAGVVLVTHRMDEALIADRLYGLLHGHVEVEGSPSQLLRDDAVRRHLNLDVPERFVLGEALEAAGVPVRPGEALERMAGTIWPS